MSSAFQIDFLPEGLATVIGSLPYLDPEEALNAAYDRDENDEFVSPSSIGEKVPMQDGDALLFMNFRADRAREITRTFCR